MATTKSHPRAAQPWYGQWYIPVLLVAGAFVLRFIYLNQMQHLVLFDFPHMDERYHLELARQINSPRGFPPEPFYRAPLYPYLFAFIYNLVGNSLYLSRLVHVVIGSFLPLVILGLGQRVFNRKIAIVTAVIAVVYPTFLYFDASLLIASTMTILTALLVWQLYRCQRDTKIVNFIIAGALLGLAGLARPNILLFGPALAIWAWFVLRPELGLKKTAIRYAAIGVTSLIVILPVTVRNYMVSGEPIFIAWQGGFNFFLGNNRAASGWSATAPGIDFTWQGGYKEAIQIAEASEGRKLTRSEVSDFWYDKAWDEIKADPGHFVSLLIRKARLLINGYEIPNNQSLYMSRDYSWLIAVLMWKNPFYFPYGLVAPLALIGIALSIRRWRQFMLLYLILGSYAVSLLLFFVCARFRQPMLPFLILFAAFGVVQSVEYVRQRRWRTIAIVLAAFVALFAESNHDALGLPDRRVKAEDQFTIGTSYLERSRFDAAAEHFHEAVRLDSTFAPAWSNLGFIASRNNQPQQAAEDFARAIQYEPQVTNHYLNYAAAQSEMGHPERAVEPLLQAARMKPFDDDIYLRLAGIYLELNQPEKARSAAAEALRLNPRNGRARRVLRQLDGQ